LVPVRDVGFADGSRPGAAPVSLVAGVAFLRVVLRLAGAGARSASVPRAGASTAGVALGRPRGRDRRRGGVLVGGGGCLAVVVLGADGSHALAGDDHPLRSAVATDDSDQEPAAEAAEDLVDGAALDLERLGERQDRAVGALRGGAEDDSLGIA
jgi:hypothetical protein